MEIETVDMVFNVFYNPLENKCTFYYVFCYETRLIFYGVSEI